MFSIPGLGGGWKAPSWLFPIIGYGISISCLIWVYRGFDWKTELPRFMASDWRWLTLAVVADLVVYVLHGWRWSTLLKPVGRAPILRSIQAVYVGLFANEVLPLRSGELVRCYVQGRWSRIPFSVTLSSAVIERLFDGIWLLIGFYLVLPFVSVPRYLRDLGFVIGGVLIVAAVLIGIVMFKKHRAHAAVAGSRWSEALWHVVEGLHAMGNSRSFLAAAGVSFLYFATQALPIYALMQSYGLDLSLGAAAIVLVILRLGTVLPQAPSNVGAFQFFTVVGLSLVGIEKTVATGFATMMFFVVTVPLWLGGLLAITLAGVKIKDLQRDAQTSLQSAAVPAAHSVSEL
jgi:uncharacterized protein (TIRG00374 family)